MKLKNVLITVTDVEQSKLFYKALFGLDVVADFGENVILTEGLVLQGKHSWQPLIGKNVTFGGNDGELYFEENDMDGFVQKLDNSPFQIEYLVRCMEHACERKLVRIYDPDHHLIEIAESLEHAVRRRSNGA